jgi:hypothetical protein
MVSDGNKNPIIFITLMIFSLNEVYIRSNYYKSKDHIGKTITFISINQFKIK